MNTETVIKGLETIMADNPFDDRYKAVDDAIALLKEQDARIHRYEYVFDFIGIGFKTWARKIIEGSAEADCETDEHGRKTVITFRMI